jgi:tRNA(Ile2) C34 agmatinyltransferase TiaS
MIRPKSLDMAKIERIFNEQFEFAQEDLEKGFTVWTLTPKREANCPKCKAKLQTGKIVSKGYDFYCSECDEDFYKVEIKND